MTSQALGALVGLLVGGVDTPSPLINYHEMAALKGKLAGLVVEIEVVPAVPEGADPSFRPTLAGQGAFVLDPAGTAHLVTSSFLVENAESIRFRTKDYPDWTTAGVDSTDPSGLAFLSPRPSSPASLPQAPNPRLTPPNPQALTSSAPRHPSPLTPHPLVRAGSLVFSVDNPTTTMPNIFWGFLEGLAEPPLSQHLLTSIGLPLGCPLFSSDGALVAMNLRNYSMHSQLILAASATQIARALTGSRREPLGAQPSARRGPTGVPLHLRSRPETLP